MQQNGTPKKARSIHRAWWVLAGCVIMQTALGGVCNNTMGFYAQPLQDALGTSAGAVSAYYTVRSMCYGVGTLFVHRVYARFPMRRVMVAGIAVYALAYLSLAGVRSLPQLYFAGIMNGLSSGVLMVTPTTLVINNWFRSRLGLSVGLCVASLGIGSMLFSPVASYIIANFGWRMSVMVTVAVAVCLSLPMVLKVMVYHPDEVGEQPFDDGTRNASAGGGDVYSKLLPGAANRLVFLVLCIGVFSAIASNCMYVVPAYSASLGYSIATAGVLNSLMMAGNVFFKVFTGWLYDRFDSVKITIGALAAVSIGILGMVFLPGVVATGAGILLFSVQFAFYSVTLPILVREAFGPRLYVQLYTKFVMVCSICNSLFYVLFGFSLDATGSYNPAFLLVVGMYGVAVCLLLWYARIRKKALQG